MAQSLWGEEFNPPVIIKKPRKSVKTTRTASSTVSNKKAALKLTKEEQLSSITSEVIRILGVYKNSTVTIKSVNEFKHYIDKCIENKIVAVDTETNNSLDPVNCKIMGLCLYTPGQKSAYIPVNHVDKDGKRFDWQVKEEDIHDAFEKINATTYSIYHNGKFDYSVIKCTCKVEPRIDWDTMIGAKLLDENEISAGLKQQYIQKIDSSIEKYDIEHLFKNVQYADVDPEVFALYSATDAYMTYKLFLYQKNIFDLPENTKLLSLAEEVEMPLVKVLAEMQLNGMEVDQAYAKRLSNKYHKLLDQIDVDISKELELLEGKINNWRQTEEASYKPPKKKGEGFGKSKNEQLDSPINLASPTQLAILLYDVLRAPQVNKKSPRGTGEEDLKQIDEKLNLPLIKLILKRREYVKLISTYVDTIPELATRWKDGRVRTHFNAYGAATGRLSSSDPLNFQNIPAKNKLIRMLFRAKEGYKIVGSDYSAQEPRLASQYSHDERMIQAYKEGKDLYAVIASAAFNKPYEDCLEFYPEGTKIIYEGKEVVCGNKTHQNKEGKSRRSAAKSILLGVLYGRGAASVAEQIGKSYQEAQDIIDQFFKSFPKVKQWIDNTMNDAHVLGYVEDIAGRRRRLPDIKLNKYEITNSRNKSVFNPLLGASGNYLNSNTKQEQNYLLQCFNSKSRKQLSDIIYKAKQDGIDIKDNTGYIAQAERQAVNSRVQGGAATLTKTALINIYYDKELKELGAYLINTVHDEILVEAPSENAQKVADRLVKVMIDSAKKYVPDVPMKCDPYIVDAWYNDEYAVLIENEYKHQLENNSEQQALQNIIELHDEETPEYIRNVLAGYLKN